MFQKIKSFIKNPGKKEKIAAGAMTVAAATAAFMPMVLAAPNNPINQNVNMGDIIGSILGIIVDIFLAIGILLAAWAIGMLVLAFKNEDADSKSRAMMMLIVSVALIGAETLVKVVLSAANVGFSIGQGLF